MILKYKSRLLSWILLIYCTFKSTLAASKPDSIEGLIYTKIPSSGLSHCIRMLNATGQIGCSSSLNGNVGVVVVARNNSQLTRFLEDTTLDGLYMLAVTDRLFVNPKLMARVRESKKVNGLAVLDSLGVTNTSDEIEAVPDLVPFSEDSVCPNALYSAVNSSQQCSIDWNPAGTDYSRMQWPFPVVIVGSDYRHVIEDCYDRFNAGQGKNHSMVDGARGRQCAMEISAGMSAVGDAKICIRRNGYMSVSIIRIEGLRFCDNYEANNKLIWLQANQTHLKEKSVLLMLVRLDAHSMFPLSSYGARSVVPAAVVMSAVAVRFLNEQFAQPKTSNRDVVFAFLDGESLDYLGSTWLAYQLTSGLGLTLKNMTLNSSHISEVVELGPLGMSISAGAGNIYLHTRAGDISGAELAADLKSFANTTTRFKVTHIVDDVMPPGSNQALPRHGLHLPSLLVADFNQSYSNPYSESFLDRSLWQNGSDGRKDRLLADMAEMVYRFVYKKTFGPKVWTPPSEVDWIVDPDEVANCFVYNTTCGFFQDTFNPNTIAHLRSRPGPVSAYSGVKSVLSLSYLIGEINIIYGSIWLHNITNYDQCSKANENSVLYDYYFFTINGTERCVKTLQLQYTNNNAYDYEKAFSWDGTRAAVWMQSHWEDNLRLRVFLLPTKAWQIVPLAVGLAVTLITGIIVYLVKKKAAAQLLLVSG